ncbi:hypothetical protein Hanom_Chr01g00090311 [Helianthus anomalus]
MYSCRSNFPIMSDIPTPPVNFPYSFIIYLTSIYDPRFAAGPLSRTKSKRKNDESRTHVRYGVLTCKN